MLNLEKIDFYGRNAFHSKTIELKYGLKELPGPDATGKEVCYTIGCGHEPDLLNHLFSRAKVGIVHWIGTDVMCLQHDGVKPIHKDPRIVHFCDWYNLKVELAEMGINAEVVIHEPANMPKEVMPLGDEVMVFMPELRHDFFRYDLMKQCEEEYKKQTGKEFIWINTRGGDWDAMRKFDTLGQMAKCRTLIRAPEHDGCSHTVLEMLLAGRSVLHTVPMPYCRHIEPTVESIIANIDKPPYQEAPHFYRTLLKDRGLIPALEKIYESIS